MGIMDALFGEEPDTQIKSKPTMSPAQQRALDQLISFYSGKIGITPGAGDPSSFITGAQDIIAGKGGKKKKMKAIEALFASTPTAPATVTGPAGATPGGTGLGKASVAIEPTNDIFTGSVETNPIPLESLSLAALEDRSREIAAGGNPLEMATSTALLDIITSGGTPTGGQTFDDFFKTNIQDPLTQNFEDEARSIGTRFGGNALFTSDRREADARAKDDFLESLTSSRADLAFRERSDSVQNLMTALGLSGDASGRTTNELLGMLGGAHAARDFDADNARASFDKWKAEQDLKKREVDQLLAALGISSFENIGITSGGSSGVLGPIIQAGGSILGGMASGGTGVFRQPTRGRGKK